MKRQSRCKCRKPVCVADSQKSRDARTGSSTPGKYRRLRLEALVMTNSKKNITIESLFAADSIESSTTSSSTTSNGDSRIDPSTQMIVHTVSAKDTLQGLAIKYGVTMSDLKRENKLTTNNSIYSRKEILIPTTVSQLQKTVELKTHQQEKEKFQLELLCEQFFEQTNCKDEEVATKYLRHSSSNLQRAVEIYLLESQVKESVRKLRIIANSRDRVFPRPEATDTTKLLSPSASLYYHQSFATTPRRTPNENVSPFIDIDISPITKQKKSQMSASYNDIYDL